MPSITRDGVRIHYELAGAGPPALLIHAFSGSHGSWVGYGFVERLQGHHQLILPDLRGHGLSDGPALPEAYRPEELAEDMVALLDALGVERVHCLGYSMGGLVALSLATRHPARLRTLALGSCSPYPPAPGHHRHELLALYERAAIEGPDALVEGIRAWAGGSISPAYEARLRAANIAAGAACLRWLAANPPDYSAALPGITLPCLIYCGDADANAADARRAAATMPQGRSITLPGMGHVQGAGASAEIAPHLLEHWR